LAAEKLTEHHGCSLSRETLRGWMIVDGLGQDRRHRLRLPHQPRRRRDCLGDTIRLGRAAAATRMHWAGASNTGEQDQRCRLENSLPGRANTRFNDSQPFRNCPSSGCKALVVKRGRSGRPVYSRSIPRPKSDNLSAGSLLRRSTARPEWQEVRWRLFWKIVCWDGDHANEPRLASRWRAAPGRIADSRRRRQ